jgi:hypothetical protein
MHRKREINACRLVYKQLGGLGLIAETRRRYRNRVFCRGNLSEGVRPGAGGGGGECRALRSINDRDFRSGYERAAWVFYNATQRGGCGLAKRESDCGKDTDEYPSQN